jgi:hypothetical protein
VRVLVAVAVPNLEMTPAERLYCSVCFQKDKSTYDVLVGVTESDRRRDSTRSKFGKVETFFIGQGGSEY